MPDFNYKDEFVDVKNLKNSVYNPRRISEEELEKLEKSIEEFGFIEPLVVNTHEGRENVVICGHQRLKVAKKQGAKKIRAVLVDLPLDKEMKLNIASNKIGGDFDFAKLADLFEKLDEMKSNTDTTGFNRSDIDQMLQNTREFVDRHQKSAVLKENLEKSGISADEAEAISSVFEHSKEIAKEEVPDVDICGQQRVRKMIVFWFDNEQEWERMREIYSTGRDIEQDTNKLTRITDEANIGDPERLKMITEWYYNKFLPENGKTNTVWQKKLHNLQLCFQSQNEKQRGWCF